MAGEDEDFEEDVVMQGSPLHEHLVQVGFINEQTQSLSKTIVGHGSERRECVVQKRILGSRSAQSSPKSSERRRDLARWLATELVTSELLLEEDVLFIENFVLKSTSNVDGKGFLQNVLHKDQGQTLYVGLVGLLGLVASGVYIFHHLESDHLALASATLLPSVAASLSSLSTKRDESRLKTSLENLLRDMKLFKNCLRKSLNFIKGQEQLTIVSSIHQATASNNYNDQQHSSSSLINALDVLPACLTLRRSVFSTSMQLLLMCRRILPQLLQLFPMEEETERDYLSFVSLNKFNLDAFKQPDNNELSIDFLRDVAQLALAHQSELLRRLTLTLELDESISSLTSVMKALQETLRSVNTRLEALLHYHSSWGIDKQGSSRTRLSTRGFEVQRTYKTLFTTGLQLQQTLLTVRNMERCFEMEPKLSEKEIMKRLEAAREQLAQCLDGLDTNLKAIQYAQGGPRNENVTKKEEECKEKDKLKEEGDKERRIVVDESSSGPLLQDEVFTAVALKEESSIGEEEVMIKSGGGNNGLAVRRVLKELKSVLVKKAEEHSLREQAALRRVGVVDDGGESSHNSLLLTKKDMSCSSSDEEAQSDHNNDERRRNYTRIHRCFGGIRAAPSLAALPLEPVASLLLPRSLSAPDLRKTNFSSSSQNYVHFSDNSDDTDDKEDDESIGSVDAMMHQVLKTYRRPLRPAALKSRLNGTLNNDDVVTNGDANEERGDDLGFSCEVDRSLAVEAALKARMMLMGSKGREEEICEDVFE